MIADQQWQTVQEEEQENEELLQLSNQILDLTRAIHQMAAAQTATGTHPTGTNGTQPGSHRRAAGESVDSPTTKPPGGLEPGKSRP